MLKDITGCLRLNRFNSESALLQEYATCCDSIVQCPGPSMRTKCPGFFHLSQLVNLLGVVNVCIRSEFKVSSLSFTVCYLPCIIVCSVVFVSSLYISRMKRVHLFIVKSNMYDPYLYVEVSHQPDIRVHCHKKELMHCPSSMSCSVESCRFVDIALGSFR